MLVNREHSPAAMKAEVSLSDGDSEPHVHPKASMWKNSKSKNKRKFSDEQIRLLESMFEAESRPELQIKQQLANELGLQPRQVAIWFQNKRARSKSKLVEQEYSNLKRNYDTLASKYDSLKKENQRLLTQLQRLRKLMGKPQESWNRVLGQTGISVDKESDNKDTTNSEAEKKTNSLLDCHNHEIQMPSLCDDGNENVEYFVEEIGILNMEELVPDRSSLTSSGNWCSFEAGLEFSCVLDRPSCSSEWWEL